MANVVDEMEAVDVGFCWHALACRRRVCLRAAYAIMVRDDPKLLANDVDTTAFITDIPAVAM